jgi:hypothetical protein
VDPVPDPLLLRKSGSAGNRTGTSMNDLRINTKWSLEERKKMYLVKH